MKFMEAIHLALAQATTVQTALAGGKVYQSFVDPTAAMPFVCVSAQSDERASDTLAGPDKGRLATVQVDCVASSLASANNIADAVRVDLDKASGSLATTTNSPFVVNGIFVENGSFQYDPGSDGTEVGAFICAITLKILYFASTPSPVALSAS